MLDDEDEESSVDGKLPVVVGGGRMGNRMAAAAGRLPTTEELEEEQDGDEGSGDGNGDVSHLDGLARRKSVEVRKGRVF